MGRFPNGLLVMLQATIVERAVVGPSCDFELGPR